MGVHDDGLITAGNGPDDAGPGPEGACTCWTRRDPDVLREVLAALRQLD